MKKYASVKIKNTEYDKTVTIDKTDCNGIVEIFRKVDSVLINNCLLSVGDKLDWINFYEVEEYNENTCL